MSTLTYYVCDCCGAQSSRRSIFNTAPVTPVLGLWLSNLSGVLLCPDCSIAATTALSGVLSARLGANTGTTVLGG